MNPITLLIILAVVQVFVAVIGIRWAWKAKMR